MKARGDFKNEFQYQDYLIAYYAGLMAATDTGGHQQVAETAVRKAAALAKAVAAYSPEDDEFIYDREDD